MTDNLINFNYNNLIGVPSSSTTKLNSSSGSDFSSLLQNAVSTIDKTQTGSTGMDGIFERAANQYRVPIKLLKAVAKNESNFNANAVSSCGAQGVMQLMPSTAKSLGVQNPLDAEQNIMGGAKYLSQMLDRYDGDTTLALAAYNAGSGNVAKYGGVPPFKETQTYISRVMKDAGEDISVPSTLPSLSSVLGSALSSSKDSSLASILGSSDSSDSYSSLSSLLSSSLAGSTSSLSISSLIASSLLSGQSTSLTTLLSSSLSSDSTNDSSDSGMLGSSTSTYDDYISYLQLYIAQMQAKSTQMMTSDISGLISSDTSGSLL